MQLRVIGALAALLVLSVSLCGAATIQPLVLTGQAVPGIDGAVFQSVGVPSINKNGDVIFRADLAGTDIRNGIFLASKGKISRVISYGDNVPKSVSTFFNFGDPVISDTGQIAFKGRIGTGFENTGIFLVTSAGLTRIAATGDSAPGTTGKFVNMGQHGVVLNGRGTLAFQATYDGTQSGDGIFEYSNGSLRSIVLSRQLASTSSGATFDRFFDLAINGSDQIAFTALIKGGGGPSGIFVAGPQGTSVVALEKQSGPYAGGAVFGHLSQPSINEAGEVVFVDSAVNAQARGSVLVPKSVILSSSSGNSVLANKGAQIRQTEPFLSGDFQRPIIVRTSDGTNAVFFASWNDVRGRGALFYSYHNSLTQLVQEGDSSIVGGAYSFVGNLAPSSSGQFVFVSNLKGAGAKAGIFVSSINF